MTAEVAAPLWLPSVSSKVFLVEVSTVETVPESVAFRCRSVVEGAPLVPAVPSVVVPAVSSAVSDVYLRAAEVVIVAVRIARVNGKVPYAGSPVQRSVEVRCGAESAVLPVQQDVAKVEVALPPIRLVEVVGRVYAHKVVEVHLVGGVILFFGQVKFVGHLVRQEQSLVACLLVAHCTCGGRYGGENRDYGSYTFHDDNLFCSVSCCKVTYNPPHAERFFPNFHGEIPYSYGLPASVPACTDG